MQRISPEDSLVRLTTPAPALNLMIPRALTTSPWISAGKPAMHEGSISADSSIEKSERCWSLNLSIGGEASELQVFIPDAIAP
jgi:hypothetical protein